MKFNGTTIKVILALVLVVGAVFWAVDSVRSRSYSAANLTFGLDRGPVKITNASDQTVAVQLIGTGSRTFSTVSPVAALVGTSTREGTGSNSTQVLNIALPPGVSEFSVVRAGGAALNVNFVAATNIILEATTQPLDANGVRNTYIAAALVILGALFYASNATGHRWFNTLRGKETPTPATELLESVGGQGELTRSYGDNRSNP
jgi:hypothetical protein